MAKWTLREVIEIPESIRNFSFPLGVLKLLTLRGIDTEQKMRSYLFADYDMGMHDPFLFSSMEKVVNRVKFAMENKQLVAIFGDYDADGITSSAIVKQTMSDLGIDSFVYIPDKKKEGYGLNLAAIEEFNKRGVKLIITVDCGITGVKEVEKANEYGIDTIITDHHHVPETLPPAYAIINPHQKDCGYPFAELAGVGVAFKVVQALYERLLPAKKDQIKLIVEFVATGTVADCVPLIDENRTIVKFGLIVLSKTRRMGLRELFAVGKIEIDEVNIPDVRKISFHIAPRINAAGRINHANLAYNLIVETDNVKCRDFALELEASNSQRQKITEEIVKEIRGIVNEKFEDKKFIFAAGEHFSIGIVGLVAGKIAQEFNRPVAVFQTDEKQSKGSFRSIPQINIIDVIEKCKEHVVRYGGHAQAAGVTVANENLEKFCMAISAIIEKQLDGMDMSKEILIDAEVTAEEIDFDFADCVEKLKPFGEGNVEPIFLMRKMLIHELKTVGAGSKHHKISLKPQDGTPKIFDAIAFNSALWESNLFVGNEIDLVFNIQKDTWNGNNRIQFVVQDLNVSGVREIQTLKL